MPDIRKKVSHEDLRLNPHAAWNAFIDLLATSEYADLRPSQRPAHLIFWYESEVQNGGHLQFFLNRELDQVPETIDALRKFDAKAQADLLEQAVLLWKSKPRSNPSDAQEYVDIAIEGEFDEFNNAFYGAPVELNTVLEKHLFDNESEFIVRE